MQVGLFDRPFVPLNLMSKSWDLCSLIKFQIYPRLKTANIIRVQEKGTQIGMSECLQGFILTPNVS